jgi:CubicO group peptidase (beta-lactamase class C family)
MALYFLFAIQCFFGFQRLTLAATAGDELKKIASAIPQVEKLVAQEYQKDKGGSLTVGIIYSDQLIWAQSLGYSSQPAKKLADGEIPYPIASVTKIITGLMLLQLTAEGRVHLADPADKYLPELKTITSKYPWVPPITLIQLATMSAGFGIQTCSLNNLRFSYEPGTRRMYSNQSYCY